MERLLLTTGGTGGHIFPALAVAEALRRECPRARILFVGSDYGPEVRLAAAAGLEFEGLPARGFVGRGFRAAAAAGRMVAAFGRALGVLRRFRPQVVAGFGGYAAFAPMLAGRCLGVPCVLHEQNAVAGASNRLLGRLARRICLSLPQTAGFPPERCVLTGNPVRAAVAAVGEMPRDFSGRRLLIMGGSLGAHALNEHVAAHLARLRAAGVEIRHQTGKADEAAVRAAYAAAGYDPACVSAFIDDMAAAYAWADLALCRAGATSVAELCAAGVPSVLVPFPFAAHDHQTRNAEALRDAGAALLVPQSAMSEADIVGVTLSLLNDPGRRAAMSAAARRNARPDAAARVLREIRAACGEGEAASR